MRVGSGRGWRQGRGRGDDGLWVTGRGSRWKRVSSGRGMKARRRGGKGEAITVYGWRWKKVEIVEEGWR